MNAKVDAYLGKVEEWKEEFEELRAIALSCGLEEEFKWGNPCYAVNGGNVVLIHGFKEYCALLFFKGALMKDPKGILIIQSENVQAARQVRFTKLSDIVKLKTTLKAYIREAMEIEKAGWKVALKKTSEFKMPDEFKKKLKEKPALKAAFEKLTPGRQRAYLLHFSSAKQAQTREARIEKCMPQIMKGKGLND